MDSCSDAHRFHHGIQCVYFVAFFVLPSVAFSISCNSSSLHSGAKRVFPSAIVSPAKKIQLALIFELTCTVTMFVEHGIMAHTP